jgi:hypothetical protein
VSPALGLASASWLSPPVPSSPHPTLYLGDQAARPSSGPRATYPQPATLTHDSTSHSIHNGQTIVKGLTYPGANGRPWQSQPTEGLRGILSLPGWEQQSCAG